jgi:hypothetical protein
MNYQRIYNNIVERGKIRIVEGYTESHHIIPRCMGGTDNLSNLVNLTAEEHYVCHQLLVKIYPDEIGLVRAAMFMTASGVGPKRQGNKMYGWLKRRFSEYMKGPNNPSTVNGTWNKGITGYKNKVNFSEKTINSMIERMKNNNPCAGVKPWNHPRATVVTKNIWAKADEIYDIWIANSQPSYCKLYGLAMNKKYNWKTDGKEAGPFMNMVKYFRNGWVPTKDLQWKELKETV